MDKQEALKTMNSTISIQQILSHQTTSLMSVPILIFMPMTKWRFKNAKINQPSQIVDRSLIAYGHQHTTDTNKQEAVKKVLIN